MKTNEHVSGSGWGTGVHKTNKVQVYLRAKTPRNLNCRAGRGRHFAAPALADGNR